MLTFIVFVLTALEVVTALFLIGIILIQQSKAGGGLGAVGGGVTETVFGATAGNVLTKGTVILASIFFVVTLLLAIITGQGKFGKSVADGISVEQSVPAEAAAEGSGTSQAVPAAAADTDTAESGTPVETSAQSKVTEAAEGATATDSEPKATGDAVDSKTEGGDQ